MWLMLAKWFAGFVTGPVFDDLLKGYQAKLAAGNTSEKISADLAARELAVQQRELELQTQLRIAEIGKWYEPDHVASYIFVAYLFQVVVLDTMFGLGTTSAVKGEVGQWLGMIAAFLFGKRGLENIARIIKR